MKALLKEIEGRAEELRRARANTIYIGGGTPSQMDAKHLTDIFDAVQRVTPLQSDAEVTIECNPDDVTPEFVASLKSMPVNRISMGVQTFDEFIKAVSYVMSIDFKRRHLERSNDDL